MADQWVRFVIMISLFSLCISAMDNIARYTDIGYGDDPSSGGGSFYNPNEITELNALLNASVAPSGGVASTGDSFDAFRGLSDSIVFGSINNILKGFNSQIYFANIFSSKYPTKVYTNLLIFYFSLFLN